MDKLVPHNFELKALLFDFSHHNNHNIILYAKSLLAKIIKIFKLHLLGHSITNLTRSQKISNTSFSYVYSKIALLQ